jgi:hypothetical protein
MQQEGKNNKLNPITPEEAYDQLTNGTLEQKKLVRERIVSHHFSGKDVLHLFQMILENIGPVFGRAKRSAIVQWYSKKPLDYVISEIENTPDNGSVSHSQIVTILRVDEACTGERYDYISGLVDTDTYPRCDKVGKNTRNPKGESGFWKFIKELFQ